MLNHIFSFVSLEKKIVGFTAYIKKTTHLDV